MPDLMKGIRKVCVFSKTRNPLENARRGGRGLYRDELEAGSARLDRPEAASRGWFTVCAPPCAVGVFVAHGDFDVQRIR